MTSERDIPLLDARASMTDVPAFYQSILLEGGIAGFENAEMSGIRDTSVTAKGVNMRTLKLFPRISIVTGLLLEKLQQVVDFGGFRINCSNNDNKLSDLPPGLMGIITLKQIIKPLYQTDGVNMTDL
ncbi:hypothetical protein LOAG_02438 [Loa loa]|uniref:Uncharacterized protein n=1 Tax=Loa loa TaxID=7209 RepID=A0A1S0U8M4_LOALO|nr:hypothetical protein LOAG_02438 [Loa loa]EFO26047.1 hypothetical protein LOAG_02438 [Loa loa]